MVDLGTLGGITSQPSWAATAINSNGDIVGYSATPGDEEFHATLWR